MKTCGYKKLEEIYNDETVICVVPEIDNVRVKINPNPKDESEYYIILE